jgi:hypothetical protein
MLILCRKTISTGLVKALLALRIALSTASTSWTDQFLELQGLDTLSDHLRQASLKAREGSDMNEQVINEITKCLRAVMNTNVRLLDIERVKTD